MKLNTEIKTAHLLTGIGLSILLGLLLAYLLAPRLFTGDTVVVDEATDIFKIPDNKTPVGKPNLLTPQNPNQSMPDQE